MKSVHYRRLSFFKAMSCEKAVPYLYTLLSVGTVDNCLSSFCCRKCLLTQFSLPALPAALPIALSVYFLLCKSSLGLRGGEGDVFVTLAYEWGGGGGGLNRTMICVFPVTMGRERGNQQGFGDEAPGKKNSKKSNKKFRNF
jgi:hypothetical protein